jgi:hypothetical protein
VNTLTEHRSSAELLLGTASLEELRNKALQKIEAKEHLTETQKKSLVKELDFLLEYERLRRLRRVVWQWHDEKRDRHYNNLKVKVELLNELLIGRKKTALEVARLDSEMLKIRLEMFEKIRKLRPQNDNRRYLRNAERDFLKLKLQQRYSKLRERHLVETLENRIIRRTNFLKKVRANFPDLEEELMAQYDRQMYEIGGQIK